MNLPMEFSDAIGHGLLVSQLRIHTGSYRLLTPPILVFIVQIFGMSTKVDKARLRRKAVCSLRKMFQSCWLSIIEAMNSY